MPGPGSLFSHEGQPPVWSAGPQLSAQKTRHLSKVLHVQFITNKSLVRHRLFVIITALAGLILHEICLFNSTKGICLMVHNRRRLLLFVVQIEPRL